MNNKIDINPATGKPWTISGRKPENVMMTTDSQQPETVAEAKSEATLAAPSCYAPPDAPKWAIETMQMINKLTPDIKGKAFEPDWFLLRQRLEEAGRVIDAWPLLREMNDSHQMKRWSLSWHPHTKECRYGWYHNRTLTGGGLWMQLNIPLLGDFGLWQHWQPSASVPNDKIRRVAD